MSAMLTDLKDRAAALARIGRWRLVFVSYASLWMAWSTATNQVDMSKLGLWDWFQTIGGCFGNWATMMAGILIVQGKAIATGHVPGLEEVDEPQVPPPQVPPTGA